MSGSYADLNLAKCFDPRLDLDKKRYYTVLKGPTSNNVLVDNATTYSTSSIIHTIIAPSTNVVLSRRIYLRWRFTLTFTFNNTGTAGSALEGLNILGLGNGSNKSPVAYDALRANPISNLLNTAQVSINNETFSVNTNEHIQALTRYHDFIKEDHEFSISPSMPDQFQNYADGTSTLRNPLVNYQNQQLQLPRGASVFYSNITALSNNQQSVDIDICEPLYLSPMIWGKFDRDSGLIGLQNMKFIFNLGPASTCWSHVYQQNTTNNGEQNQITAVSMSFASQYPPQLLYTFSSIDDIGVKYDPMEKYVYPYYEIVSYPTPQTGTVAPQASGNVTTSNIQLASVPNKLYVFLSEAKDTLMSSSSASCYKSNSFARITGVSVQFNNTPGILSSADERQLYLMSVANGLQMSWEQFHVRCGSVLCLQFGKDIGLPPDLAPGVLGTFQLQITIQYTNPISSSYDSSVVNPSSYFPSGTKSWTPWVVVVSEGTLTIHNQRLTRNMGVLSRSDVVAVSAMPDVHVVPYEETDTLYGGSFLSGLKSLAGRVFNGLKDSGLLSQGRKALVGMLPVSGIAKDAINNVADSVGLGATGGLLTGMIDADEIGGGRKKKAPAKKRVMRGGRIMSRKELMAQLSE